MISFSLERDLRGKIIPNHVSLIWIYLTLINRRGSHLAVEWRFYILFQQSQKHIWANMCWIIRLRRMVHYCGQHPLPTLFFLSLLLRLLKIKVMRNCKMLYWNFDRWISKIDKINMDILQYVSKKTRCWVHITMLERRSRLNVSWSSEMFKKRKFKSFVLPISNA